jgi:hypothetical protein
MGRLQAIAIGTLLLIGAGATRSNAQTEDLLADKKFRLVLNGAFGTRTLDFSESRKFTEFLEQTTLEAQYQEKPGLGFDVGVQYNVVRHFGVLAGFSAVSGDGSGSYSAALPHPLYFNQPRRVSGSIDGLKYKETAGHLDLVATGASGHFEFAVFAGATFFNVQVDLAEAIHYTQSYPYDSVTITGVPAKNFTDSPIGFNVGGRLDYGLGRARRFGLGAQVRFSRATVKLAPTESNSLTFDAGGVQASAGIRVAF